MTKRRLCEGLTGSCRAQAMPGSHFCAHHDPDLTPQERAARISPRWAEAARLHNSGELERLRRDIGVGPRDEPTSGFPRPDDDR